MRDAVCGIFRKVVRRSQPRRRPKDRELRAEREAQTLPDPDIGRLLVLMVSVTVLDPGSSLNKTQSTVIVIVTRGRVKEARPIVECIDS